MNDAAEDKEKVKPNILEDFFVAFWPKLQQQLAEVAKQGGAKVAAPRRNTEDLVEEVLELARNQQRVLVSKEDLNIFSTLLLAHIDRLDRNRSLFVNQLPVGLGQAYNVVPAAVGLGLVYGQTANHELPITYNLKEEARPAEKAESKESKDSDKK